MTMISPCSVNLTALLQKLIRTWPKRSGSPLRLVETAGSMSKINSSPLAEAFSEIRLPTFSSTLSRSKSMVSTDSLPASIFEKSRMSLMIPSRVLARLLNLPDVVLLPGIELGLQRQMRHADDGVHGRADLMAHVGQEIRFHLGRFLGHFLGMAQFLLGGRHVLVDFLQFLLTGGDLAFGSGKRRGLEPGLLEQLSGLDVAGEDFGIHRRSTATSASSKAC